MAETRDTDVAVVGAELVAARDLGYGCVMPPGPWVSSGTALRPPVGRIHRAGAETAATWNSYMDGAARSSEDAARAVQEQLDG